MTHSTMPDRRSPVLAPHRGGYDTATLLEALAR